jgi:flagellar biosynthetic protein FliR
MPDQALSQALLAWAFSFIMVLCRAGAAIMLLPAFADDGTPTQLRAGFALALTLLLLPTITPHLPPEPHDFPTLVILLCGELLAGGLLGWLARLICLSLPAAGQIVSLTTGHSSVLQPDQNFGAQTAAIGQLFGRLAPVLILSSGLYILPLMALAGSYDALPPGKPPPGADITEIAVRIVATHFALALQLAAPFLLLSTLWHTGLGLVSRLVPHIQIHFAALPGQILGGLLLLSLLAVPLTQRWLHDVAHAFAGLPGS